MHRVVRKTIAAVAVAVALIAAGSRPVSAQQGCWQTETCPNTPPTVVLSVTQGNQSQQSVWLAVTFADPDGMQNITRTLHVNGSNTSGWYSTAYVDDETQLHTAISAEGYLTLSAGANTIVARICDILVPEMCGADTVVVTYQPPTPPPAQAKPVLSLAQRMDRRAVNAEAATHTYTTPAYFSFDSPRSLVLAYSSESARPIGLIRVDATVRSSQIPTAISIRVMQGQTVVYPEAFFQGDTGSFHLAAQFASPCVSAGACAAAYDVIVRSYYGSASSYQEEVLSGVRVLGVNESTSRYGAGWSLAGIPRLSIAGNDLILWDGAGLLEYFTRTTCSGSGDQQTCDYVSPLNDVSLVRKTTLNATDGGRYYRAYPTGDTTFFNSDGMMIRGRTRFASGTVVLAWTLDAQGARLASLADLTGRTTTLSYADATGATWRALSLRSIALPDGRQLAFEVPVGTGDLTRVVGPDGRADLAASYDGTTHRLLGHAERIGSESITYDGWDRLATLKGPPVLLEGGTTGADSIVIVPRSSRALAGASNTYSGTTTKPLRTDSAYTRTVETNGVVEKVWFHQSGMPRMVLTKDAQGDSTVMLVDYDALDRVAQTMSTGRAPLSYHYNAAYGSPDTIINAAAGEVMTVAFGPFGQVQQVKLNGVVQSTAFFSGSGVRPDSIKSDTSHTVRLRYDAFGRTIASLDARGTKDSVVYDAATGNTAQIVVTVPGEAARTTGMQYDASGRPQSVTDAVGRVRNIAYDLLNRIVREVALGTDSVTYTYNDSLRVYTVRDPLGNVHQTSLNTAGWVISTTTPSNQQRTFGYDRRGNIVRRTDGSGAAVRLFKDASDRDTLRIAGSDSTWFGYDKNGRWIAARNTESVDTMYLDGAGRPSSSVSYRGSVRYQVTRRWLGLLPDGIDIAATSLSTWSQLWARSLTTGNDAARRQRTIVDFGGKTTTMTYDNAEAQLSVALPQGISVRINGFDASGAVTQTSWTGAAAAFSRTHARDSQRRVASSQYGSAEDQYTRVYAYDSHDRVSSYRDVRYWVEQVWIPWDPYNDCPGCVIPVDVEHTDTLRSEDYAYDKLANRVGSGIAYDTADKNRLVSIDGQTLVYDAEGRLTHRMVGQAVHTRYHWSALGLLDSVRVIGGPLTSYGYDGWGRRIRKTVNGVTTRYLIDRDRVAMELDANGAVVAEYTYYPGADRPHGMRRGGTQYYYVQDVEGNVVGLLNSSGAVVQQYQYSPQGTTVSTSGSVPNPIRFKGREWDAEAGLYYFRSRYYDPSIGRFASADPIGLAGGLNPFTLGDGDAVNHSDPSGLCYGYELQRLFYEQSAENEWVVHEQCMDPKVGRWYDERVTILGHGRARFRGHTAGYGSFSGAEAEAVLRGVYPATLMTAADAIAAYGDAVDGTGGAGPAVASLATMTAFAKVGRAGEDFIKAGGWKIGNRGYFVVNMRKRVSDGLTEDVLSEIKNVRRLSLTLQLRDYLKYAEENELIMQVFVREGEGTVLSKALLELEEKGAIKILRVIR